MMLIRAVLRRDAPIAALAPLLLPEDPNARIGASHRLVWSLFGDHAERRRDFLWREDRPGHFLILSDREPIGTGGLFEVESKEFAPKLVAGNRLGFVLRANPTVQPKTDAGQSRSFRSDVVMHALRQLPKGTARADARAGFVAEAGEAWLARQASAKGFTLEPGQLRIDGYATWRIPHGRDVRGRGSTIAYATLDFAGVLRVEDPVRFLAAIRAGFGRAKAFGCGLMLIRRAT